MADVVAKRGDTRPVLQATLTEGTPATAINLSTATQVKLYLRVAEDAGSIFLTKTAAITNAAAGEISVTFSAGELATAGTYKMEFEITWTGGGIETVPNNGYKTLQIVADLGP